MVEGEPQLIHKDIWSYWESELSPYYEEDYLKEEMQRYREHGKIWPEGEADFKRMMNRKFIEVLEIKQSEFEIPTKKD